MAKSDLVVIWGDQRGQHPGQRDDARDPRARKERGAKIVVVDIYKNATMQQADLPVLIRPGTDGALACAVMHCLFRDGNADRDYLDALHRRRRATWRRTSRPRSALGGGDHRLSTSKTIEAFAKLIGERKRAYFRARLRFLALA